MFSLLLDFLSLQPIISTTDNPHRQPHRPSTTTTHITITQHHQTPPPQPSTTNHHHQHNMDTPQNQPKIKQTHTRAHHKNQSKSKRTHLGHTNREREHFCELMAVSWLERCLWIMDRYLWCFDCGSLIVDRGSVDWWLERRFQQEEARERRFHHRRHRRMWIGVGGVD